MLPACTSTRKGDGLGGSWWTAKTGWGAVAWERLGTLPHAVRATALKETAIRARMVLSAV
jgi:hypothetical protein